MKKYKVTLRISGTKVKEIVATDKYDAGAIVKTDILKEVIGSDTVRIVKVEEIK